MLRVVLLFNLILCPLVISKRRQHKTSGKGGDLGGHLVSALRNDANLDLPKDEEYEDLRAELLAYHTALATLTSGRRSMKTTPCWKLGGICIDHKMCEGERYLSEVAGCKDKLEVCCFAWNKFRVRDMRDEGLGVLAMPWSQQYEIGGKGVVGPHSSDENKIRKKNPDKRKERKSDKKKQEGHDEIDHHHHLDSQGEHDDIHHRDHDHSPHRSHDQSIHRNNENPPLLVILKT